MKRLLVPVDGSPASLRAVDYAITEAKELGVDAEIHLVNVQPPVPKAVSDFVGPQNIDDFHKEEAEKEIATARDKIEAAGVKYRSSCLVGTAGEAIAHYAKEAKVDEIIMGRRGLNRLSGLLLGSVSTSVLSLVEQPVTLIK
jgi:nucleotide-binding universal stress UspA family protein